MYLIISLILKNSDAGLTVLEFLNASRQSLEEKSIDESRLVAELMLCEVLGCDRMKLYLDFEKPLSVPELKRLRQMLEMRLSDMPLQYITGKANFFGYEFKCDKRALIPRPETELLVEITLKDVLKSGRTFAEIFEIGSGTGCIAITLAREFDKLELNYEINSIESSEDALSLALENAGLHGPYKGKLRFHERDLFEIPALKRSVDYILANPPYVNAEDYRELPPEVRLYEPGSALTDNSDGLTYYRKIVSLVKEFDFKGKVICEIGFGQKEKISEILKSAGMEKTEFVNDYAGIPRIVCFEK